MIYFLAYESYARIIHRLNLLLLLLFIIVIYVRCIFPARKSYGFMQKVISIILGFGKKMDVHEAIMVLKKNEKLFKGTSIIFHRDSRPKSTKW